MLARPIELRRHGDLRLVEGVLPPPEPAVVIDDSVPAIWTALDLELEPTLLTVHDRRGPQRARGTSLCQSTVMDLVRYLSDRPAQRRLRASAIDYPLVNVVANRILPITNAAHTRLLALRLSHCFQASRKNSIRLAGLFRRTPGSLRIDRASSLMDVSILRRWFYLWLLSRVLENPDGRLWACWISIFRPVLPTVIQGREPQNWERNSPITCSRPAGPPLLYWRSVPLPAVMW
jgi:hypothetical protein